jgi:transposase-like protein
MHDVSCPHCKPKQAENELRTNVVCFGSFVRAIDQKRHQRYRCKRCGRTFSSATFSPSFRQKKRHLNGFIMMYLASGVSQRRLALNLRVNRKTIVRKLEFLASWAEHFSKEDLKNFAPATDVLIDELETFEHTRLKPLSVLVAVESGRRILGFKIAQHPARGPKASFARAKYGPRRDTRRIARENLFEELSQHICPRAEIRSDLCPHYARSIRKFFPHANHKVFKGRKAAVIGQGELKVGGFDPLFDINHTLAMLRANVNRLFRRTWNTTKKARRLEQHLAIYVLFHNWKLVNATPSAFAV